MDSTNVLVALCTAVICLPLGGIFGHAIASHVSNEARQIKSFVSGEIASVKEDAVLLAKKAAKKV